MKKRSAPFRKKTKITAQITTIPATITAALLMIIIMLTGTITAVWATTEAVPTENGTSIDEPSPTEPLRNEAQTVAAGDGSSNTQGDEGLAEEAQVGTAEEPSSSSNQSESTTIAEEDESSNEGPMFEGPSVPLNQTEIVEPLENVTSTTTSNATATNTTNSTTTRPNGKIAFLKGVNGESEFDEIFVMSADGGEQTLLISNDEYVQTRHPTWSPDGQKIAFSSLREDIDDREGIFVMNVADGDSNVTRLIDGVQPSWSPDGEKIAFVGDGGIYAMNADDGSGVTRLTDDPESDSFPTWSPDGEKIAFQRGGEFENSSEIYVMNAEDGSGVTRLTNNNVPDFQPTWSPDGERIAFVSLRDNPGGESEIYVMNAADDGSGVTRLTDDPESDSFPTWSPDGEKIAFVSLRDTETEREHNAIFLMNAEDGGNVTGLTDTDAWYSELNWGGTTTSPPADRGNNSSNAQTPPQQTIDNTISTPPQQAIEKAIAAIQNLDGIPQNVKTKLIALLRQGIDFLNNGTTTLPPPLRTNMP
ncbi:MAG TPA: hypothetical protein VFS97_06215 [Nitrososphaeraceae archaeon]|nr:hypothetical protein [Nitrososphaeraceae archaeon]